MYKKFLLVGSGNFINEIRPVLSGLALEIEIANTPQEIPLKLKKRGIDIIVADDDSVKNYLPAIRRSKIDFVILSSKRNIRSILYAKENGAADYIIKPYSIRELNLKLVSILNGKRRVSCIGGGTGLFNLLMGLKNLPNILLTSIVSMTDDGGSSGRLRESFGVLPPGDVRRSLVALSNAPQVMNDLIAYRFDAGGCLTGHSLGNLLLTALSKIKRSMPEAVSSLGDVLNMRGIVYPISTTEATLCAMFENGKIVRGESNIDLGRGRPSHLAIKKCWHEPESKADINAYSAIMNSDVVTIGPGDLYTSVITNLLIKDIRNALVMTRAKKVYICNLMTKPGETSGYNAQDHISEILKYLKGDYLDYIVISDNKNLSMDAILRYSKKKQFPVEAGRLAGIKKITKAKIVFADVSHERELIRHDSDKIALQIGRILNERG